MRGDPRNIRIRTAMAVYLIYLLVLTLQPFVFSSFWLRERLSYGSSYFLEYIFYVKILDVLNNVLLFLPLGILLYLLFEHRGGRTRGRLFGGIVFSLFLSGGIEVSQLFLDRSPSVIDLLSNVGGMVVGFYGVQKWTWVRRLIATILRRLRMFSVRFLMASVYGAVLLVFWLLPAGLNDLGTWDGSFPFLVGNEETMNRPWDGEVFLVAIYDRALRPSEVQKLYASGLTEKRSMSGLVTLYTFEEGSGDTVYDVSGRDEPLNLVGSRIRWMEGGRGIDVVEGNRLRSRGSGEKIVRALKETSQFTMEVWLRPGNLTQSGPARIVSLSDSPDRRNFTLGQSGQDIHFRVRTRLTGPNGSWIHLKAGDVLRKRRIYHLVATFHRGVERLMVDGQAWDGTIRGELDYLPGLLHMGRNDATKVALCFVALFPLSWLVYGLFRRERLILTLFFVMGLVVLVEGVYGVLFGQPFGYLVFVSGLGTAAVGGWVARVFEDFPRSDSAEGN